MKIKVPVCLHANKNKNADVTFCGVSNGYPVFYRHKKKDWCRNIEEIKSLSNSQDWVVCFREGCRQSYNTRTHVFFSWSDITFHEKYINVNYVNSISREASIKKVKDVCCVVTRPLSTIYHKKSNKRCRQTLLLSERANTCAVCLWSPCERELRNKTLRVPSCLRPSHAVCVNCLKRVVQGFQDSASTVQTVQKGLRCLAPVPWSVEPCGGHFQLSVFSSILDNFEFQKLIRFIQKYNKNTTVTCVCGDEAIFEQGSNLMHCSSGKHTCCVWCWSISCPGCTENPQLPNAPNRYFGGVRNSKITPLLVEKTVRRIEQQEVWTRPHCPECDVPLHKTSACNELTHCNKAICNVCGACSFPWEPPHLPSTHWSVNGSQGCPRFDVGHWALSCGYVCVEGDCFTEEQECKIPSHQPGILKMHFSRKQKMLKSVLNINT